VLINIGWMRETRPLRPLFTSYCYNCSNAVSWHQWRQTEWFMFFGAKSFPFLWKNFAVCPGCEFVHHLTWDRYLRLSEPGVQSGIRTAIETLQLGAKNETQKRFLMAQRSEYDARAKSAS
jgi:hypothetical protein